MALHTPIERVPKKLDPGLLQRYRQVTLMRQTVDQDRIRHILKKWTQSFRSPDIEFVDTVEQLMLYGQRPPCKTKVSNHLSSFTAIYPGVSMFLADRDTRLSHELQHMIWSSFWHDQTPKPRSAAWNMIDLSCLAIMSSQTLTEREFNSKSLPLLEAAEAGAWFIIPLKHRVVVGTLPIVKVDEQNRLHSLDSSAMQWGNGTPHYFWHGVKVEENLVMHPDKMRLGQIMAATNAEIRRVMIERYGFDRYIHHGGMVEANRTVVKGRNVILYQQTFWNDENLHVLRVTNATPEADGSYKDYMIRIPPIIHDAMEALAWTFNMTAEQYRQLIEES